MGTFSNLKKSFKKQLKKTFPLAYSNKRLDTKTMSRAKAELNNAYAKSSMRQSENKRLPKRKFSEIEKTGYTKPKQWKGDGKNEMRISEMSKSKLGRGVLGASVGASKSLLINPEEQRIPQKTKDSMSYKVGDFVGSNLAYLLPAGAVENTAKNLGAKAVASKGGQKAVQKLATKSAFKKTGQKGAKEFLERVTSEAIRDIPSGALVANNRLLTEGEKFGSKEYNKEMAINTAMDVGLGGLIDWTPVAVKGVKNKRLPQKAAKEAYEKQFGKKTAEELKYIEEKGSLSKKESKVARKNAKKKYDNAVKKAKAEVRAKVELENTTGKPKIEPQAEVKGKVDVDINAPKTDGKIDITSTEKKNLLKEQFLKGTENKSAKRMPPRKAMVEELADDSFTFKDGEIKLRKKIDPKDVDSDLAISGRKLPPKLKKRVSEVGAKVEDVIDAPRIMEDGRVRAMKNDGSKVHTQIAKDGSIYQTSINKNGTISQTKFKNGKIRNLKSGTVEDGSIPKSMGRNERKVSENLERYGHTENSRNIPRATEFGETSQAFETTMLGGRIDDYGKKLENIIHNYEGSGTKASKIKLQEKLGIAKKEIKSFNGDLDKAIERYRGLVENETLKTGADTTAFEVALMEDIVKAQRYDLLDEVVSSSTLRRSLQGQSLVASKLFNAQSPTGRALTIKKTAKAMSKNYGVDVKVSDELLERLMKASDKFEVEKLKKEIQLDMWNQVPPTMYDKINAWRYTCMLANTRTHIRNIVGNAIMVPLRTTRNFIAQGMESALVKEGQLKSKAILTREDKPLLELAKENFANNHHSLTDNTKFSDMRRPQEARVFRSKILETLRKWNTGLLEREDEWAFRPAYEKSFAQFLKANKFDVNNPSKELMDLAEKYATQEALEATYRNENALADFLARAKQDANKPLRLISGNSTSEKVIKKTWAMLVDTMVPFSKTPTNVLARSLDYSPVGLGKGILKMVDAGGDQARFLKGISDFSAGLTGTGILGVGLWLGHSGIANGALDFNDPESQFAKENGAQDYAINITLGDNTYTYSLDWATPASIPLFIGVECAKGFENLSFSQVLDALGQMTDPVFSLSMLSGLQQSLDTSFGSNNPVVDIANNTLQSRLNQYVPTLAGQFARVMTADRKTATSTSEGKLARSYESWFRMLLNKVPGANSLTEPYVDTMGERDTKANAKDYALAAFNNFVNPGVLKQMNYDDTDKELIDLGESLGSEGMRAILPKRTSSYDIKNGDETIRMNEKELTLYKEKRGQYSKEKLDELFRNSDYRIMSHEDKQKAISNIYTEARKEADKAVLMSRGVPEEDIDFNNLPKSVQSRYRGGSKRRFVDTYTSMRGYNTHVAKQLNAIMHGASFSDVQKFDSGAKRNTFGKAVVLYRLGITPEIVDTYAKRADYNGNGRRSVGEVIAFLNAQKLTREQKRVLFDVLVRSKKNPY